MENTEIQELEEQLNKKNKWIQDHPNTDPNFYEMIHSWIQFGELVHKKCHHYNEVGYPYDLDNKRCATCYDVVRVDKDLKRCYQKIKDMEQLMEICQHPLLLDKDIRDLYHEEIIYDSITGYMNYSDEYKELLCKCMIVPFFIYQETLKDPNYRYENKNEFLEMTEAFMEIGFSDKDHRSILISSILNKINERSIWHQKDKGPLFPTGGKGSVLTKGKNTNLFKENHKNKP
ncbi:MAG: hypothetical protein HFJ12_07190 [Bacilli bacterium]|nr:hypothetical protein [Bacilli bacterium]